MTDDDRKSREAEFHDRAFADETRQKVQKWYLLHSAQDFYRELLESRSDGAEVLEYGCGPGSHSYFVAEHGAGNVVGIDISPVGIEKAAAEAEKRGLENISFRVMDAEQLEFADNSFDLVCGSAILHHLDLERAYAGLARVLRPTGTALFVEPLGHNPIINLYRNRTPSLRTVDEHPLLFDDLKQADRWFGNVRARFYYLGALAAVPARNTAAFDGLVRSLGPSIASPSDTYRPYGVSPGTSSSSSEHAAEEDSVASRSSHLESGGKQDITRTGQVIVENGVVASAKWMDGWGASGRSTDDKQQRARVVVQDRGRCGGQDSLARPARRSAIQPPEAPTTSNAGRLSQEKT